jgi:DTW domain-containing protein YfiP
MVNEVIESREKCYRCYRPVSSCMCAYLQPIKTDTKFVILMHPKEFKKTKNGTGRLTHLSLPNSELYIDVDFSHHAAINAMIDDPNNLCCILYPGKNALNLAKEKFDTFGKQLIIFIIDATWPCSVKMLRISQNLQKLSRVSFTHSKNSQFQIKEQPKEFCLSTIESTQTILELLNIQGIEEIKTEELKHFLDPFLSMVEYQIQCASPSQANVRFKKGNTLN